MAQYSPAALREIQDWLHTAATGSAAMVKSRLASGIDPNVADRQRETALTRCVQHKRLDIAQLLLAHGASPLPSHGANTPLHLAASEGTSDMLSLLATKDNVDAKDGQGMTPLALAAYFGRTECVRILIALGADVHADADGNSPCLRAMTHGDCVDILEALAQAGASLHPSASRMQDPADRAGMFGRKGCAAFIASWRELGAVPGPVHAKPQGSGPRI